MMRTKHAQAGRGLELLGRYDASAAGAAQLLEPDGFAERNPAPVLRIAADGRLLYANAASHPLLVEWCGGTVCQVDDLVPEHFRRWAADVLSSRTSMAVRVERDGRTLAFELVPVSEHGFVNLYAQDVTALQQAEATRRRLAAAVEHANDAIVVTDAEARIEYANAAFEQLTGVPVGAALGRRPWELATAADSRSKAVELEAWRAALRGEAWCGRLARQRATGMEWTGELSLSPVPEAADHEPQIVAVERDVTDQVRMQDELHQASKLDAVGRLAGSVVHDFNNLLTIIGGCGELVEDLLPPGHPALDPIDMLREAADRAAGLTRQLLSFTRRRAAEPQLLDLNDIVRNVEKLLRRLIGDGIRLVADLDPEVGLVVADAGQIEQILVNLVVNARDAMSGRGCVTIRSANADGPLHASNSQAAASPGVVLAVTDTGQGMDEAIQARAFEPFFTTKGPGAGTGLGLATVQDIVKQHGGHVVCTSHVGVGTTFSVHLPRADGQVAPAAAGQAPEPLHGHERILLVEDDLALAQLVLRGLTQYGYLIETVPEAESALARAGEPAVSFDILVSDIGLPGMSGVELAAEWKGLYPSTPVVLVSGYAEPFAAGFQALGGETPFLTKPYTPASLARQIRRSLDHSPSRLSTAPSLRLAAPASPAEG
ncbi:MAG: PAS domain S-box protein [Armatimonadetes bacterium]|nr:PAS domain S-box protein [Armatimonadota bacterium]